MFYFSLFGTSLSLELGCRGEIQSEIVVAVTMAVTVTITATITVTCNQQQRKEKNSDKQQQQNIFCDVAAGVRHRATDLLGRIPGLRNYLKA